MQSREPNRLGYPSIRRYRGIRGDRSGGLGKMWREASRLSAGAMGQRANDRDGDKRDAGDSLFAHVFIPASRVN
jgi:hypothetical protein